MGAMHPLKKWLIRSIQKKFVIFMKAGWGNIKQPILVFVHLVGVTSHIWMMTIFTIPTIWKNCTMHYKARISQLLLVATVGWSVSGRGNTGLKNVI